MRSSTDGAKPIAERLVKKFRAWADGAPIQVEHIRCAADYMETQAKRITLLEKLLEEAGDMWAFSPANETRGRYDCEWNQKRLKLLGKAK